MRFKFRTFVILFTVTLCYLFLRDTIDWYFVMPEVQKDLIGYSAEEVEKMPLEMRSNINEVKKKRRNVINLGLDLQGGLYLVLGVNEELLRQHLEEKYTVEWTRRLQEEATRENVPFDAEKAKARIAEEIAKNYDNEKEAAILSAFNLIGNRVDQFGVSEPVIQKGSDNRIYISLAGIKDPQAAEEIVSKAGRLTFQLYDQETQVAFTRKYAETRRDLFARSDDGEWRIANDAVIPDDFTVPAGSRLYYIWKTDIFGLPRKDGGIFLKTEILLEGERLRYSQPSFDQYANKINVSFSLDDEGAEIFAAVTERNVGKRMAIILDDKVQSYPNIQGKIPSGNGVITGSFSPEEAKNLSAILNAGSFKVGLKVEEKRSVGPSLGRDSINAGIQATAIGAVLVVIFMLLYYRIAGIVADIAMVFNIVIILAVMTQLGATLTLPGIAGLILTIGMSVDANVIIYERIKEELRTGKSSLRIAIDKGFDRAFSAIFDANLTTLIAALMLMQLGTGAIKGFAVTLFIGILSSLFTALFLARYLIDGAVSLFRLKKLPI